MKDITIHHITKDVANIEEPVVIYEKNNTRRIFLARINNTKVEIGETVSGTLIHQKKDTKGEWQDIKSIDLRTLKGGEGVKIQFHSDQIKKLYDGITNLYEVSATGLPIGNGKYTYTSNFETILKVSEDRKELILKLLELNYSTDIWNEILEKKPDLATKLSLAHIQSNREKSLKEFKIMLSEDIIEPDWQYFFEKNQWIFGYGLNYQFTTQLSSQPYYGGTNYTGKGAQRGDNLYQTKANAKFTVLVEIKKPSTDLIVRDRNNNHKRYRNGAWLLSKELIGGISQLQVNCKTWQRTSDYPENDELSENNIYTENPKGILVIGNTKELSEDKEKIETFEIFRQSLHNPEIITYDELYERAKYIINQPKTINPTVIEIPDEDVPF